MVTPNKSAKGQGTVYFRESDQRWVGTKDLPRRDPLVRRRAAVLVNPAGMTKAQARAATWDKLNKRIAEMDENGDLPNEQQTVEQWLRVWFDTIALKKIRPKTAATYRTLLERHIIPTIGHIQLTKLTSAHVRRVEERITSTLKNPKKPELGYLSSTTASQAHRIIAVALKYAEREERVTKNVALLTDAPKRARKSLNVLTPDDARKVMQTTLTDRLGSRWAAALYTGARQGELLGLEIDRVGRYLDLSWQLQRLTWEHGCRGDCGNKRGTDCPQRTVTFPANWEHRYLTGGLWLSRPKSDAGYRMVPLRGNLEVLINRRLEQAHFEPNPYGLVWTTEKGDPIDPGADNRAWHKALERAKVPDVRLHDARHTFASVLMRTSASRKGQSELLGHSEYITTQGYQTIDDQMKDLAMDEAAAFMPLELGGLPPNVGVV